MNDVWIFLIYKQVNKLYKIFDPIPKQPRVASTCNQFFKAKPKGEKWLPWCALVVDIGYVEHVIL